VYRVPDTDELRQRLVATWAEIQQSVVYDATDQCWKDWKQYPYRRWSFQTFAVTWLA